MVAAIALSGLLHAAPIVAGERLEWSVRWMGIEAGRAWATTAIAAGEVRVEAGCASAAWLAGLYPIDDSLRSEWRPGVGSSRYRTRFREGDFQQDQDMALAADPLVVARRQRHEEGWRDTEERHAGVGPIEDPVSAFYRLRVEAGPIGERVRYRVWTGRRAATLEAFTAAAEPVEGRAALRVEVLTERASGDFEPKMTVWVSDDADRVPLVAEVRTRAGPVRATLARRVVGEGA